MWRHVDGIRKFCDSFTAASFDNATLGERVGVVIHELTENAIKYSRSGDSAELDLAICHDEEGIEVVRLEVEPVETLAERMAGAIDERTSAVLVSAVLFETARIVPELEDLARACVAAGAELLVDVYHALGAVPYTAAEHGLDTAWIVGGGYKYLQLGEGNCFMRLPPQAETMRPVFTGWFAEFDELVTERGEPGVS